MAMHQATRDFVEQEIKTDMTPMIDVTFLLLIFFMCTLHFKSVEGMLPANLPKDIGVFSKPAKRTPEEPIYIRIMKTQHTNTVIWIGAYKFTGTGKFEELYNKIVAVAQEASRIPVIIDPVVEAPFQDVISTLNVCRRINEELGNRLKIKFSAKELSKAASQQR